MSDYTYIDSLDELLLKTSSKEDFNKLFDESKFDSSLYTSPAPEERKAPPIDELFIKEETNANMMSKFTKDGLYVDGFSYFNLLPYSLLQVVDSRGQKVIGKKFEFQNVEIFIDERVYKVAKQAIDYLKEKFVSLDDAIKVLSGNTYSAFNADIIKISGEDLMETTKFAGVSGIDDLLKKADHEFNAIDIVDIPVQPEFIGNEGFDDGVVFEQDQGSSFSANCGEIKQDLKRVMVVLDRMMESDGVDRETFKSEGKSILERISHFFDEAN